MHPNLLIALCIVLWGIWGISSKLSNVHNAPVFVTLASNVLYALLSLPLLFKLKNEGEPINWSFSALSWILLTGIVGVSAKLIFNYALNKQPASIVIPATSIFPVVTVLLAVFFLKEKITLTQGAGMLLCILGVYLVTMGK
ncbi:DMT family transporter [Verrucomicrobiaceae bacterium N1E253]|uniref:DMT family transporter n=1 Tax=Oceaniferula marina TaxID=2748318 RepID=A0A851GH01_9BACT|nr:DMT family transporter [Oceaniferula marina]NWK56469.1 DMT family transporter [Oceaniferula marina]